ncbi:universal stress protein [uncultured Methanoregula sp.]|uniref:universal stress protein n=1 Tax=uncultured Methanoregula sp. TaxID=1005933 RepID=UPI002AAAAC2D|nr:universal stress protein [uncultured Methanoregula sp.]
MFNTILVAIDGSETSQRAFDKAVEIAKAGNANLHAAYVVETGLFSSLPADNTVEIMYNVLQKEAKIVIDAAKVKAAAKGVPFTAHIKSGHAGSEVITLSEKINADLIVVGSHGKSQTDRLLIGSVSTFVVTHSTVSTLVVRS